MNHKSFRTRISQRDIEVMTGVIEGGEYEIFFKGKEFDLARQQHTIADQTIRMWEVDYDPEGSEAEKVHNAAVVLLNKGETAKQVYDKIMALVRLVYYEERQIDELLKQMGVK